MTALPPPDIFQGNSEQEFLLFVTRLERYIATSQIVQDRARIDHLMYLIDPKYEQILQSFRLNAAQAGSYTAVRDRFIAYFRPRQHGPERHDACRERRQGPQQRQETLQEQKTRYRQGKRVWKLRI